MRLQPLTKSYRYLGGVKKWEERSSSGKNTHIGCAVSNISENILSSIIYTEQVIFNIYVYIYMNIYRFTCNKKY